MRTDHFTSGKKYRKLVNSVVFIRNKSLFFVSAVATSAFQLEYTSRLLRSVCPGGYQIRTIEYGKILVMLVYGEYYGQVYEVYNKYTLLHELACNIANYCTSGRGIFTSRRRVKMQPTSEIIAICMLTSVIKCFLSTPE